jgi:hypothetical protein
MAYRLGWRELRLLSLLLFALLDPRVSAHMTTVCTSTAPSNCANAELVFYFGTCAPLRLLQSGGCWLARC